MGICSEIDFEKFPEQGSMLGRKVTVCFHYDTARTVSGGIIRDDKTEPFRLIMKLDDGRVVLSDECQYQIRPDGPFRAV